MKQSDSQTTTNRQEIGSEDTLIVTTKITVPARRTALIERSRLIERLDHGTSHARLTVIIAPAGFGKTTLARQWALARDRCVAWVSLDTGENDFSRFLTYLIMAIRRVRVDFGDGVLALLRSPQPPTRETLITAFINALCDGQEPLSLVLDDYHLISDRAIHDAVTFLVDHLPPQIHLLIASRIDPPLPLARIRARGELTELRASDLRCARDEVGAFLSDIMGLHLANDQVRALEERTEGWMAGLQLAGLSLQHRSDPEAFIADFTGSNRYIVDYLGEEVLRQQPDTIRQFLYRTAVLDRLHGPLCEAVVGDLPCGKGQAILEEMESANLFLVALDDNRRWYRYHHLFGDMLRARLLLEDEALIPDLHRRALQWYESAGMFEEAIRHALVGRHFSEAKRLMEITVEDLWKRGDGFIPRYWIASLPAEYLRQSPMLMLFQARYYLMTARPDLLHQLLNEVEAILRAHCINDPTLWGQYKALRAFEAGFFNRNDDAIALAEEALTILPPDPPVWETVIRVLISNIHAERGDIPLALETCRIGVAKCEHLRDPQVVMVTRSLEATLYEAQGNLSLAESTYREALEFVRSLRTDRLPMTASAYNGLGNIAFQRNDLTAARPLIDQALLWAREMDASDACFRSTYQGIRLYLALGDSLRAKAILEELMEFAAKRPLKQMLSSVDGFRAMYYLTVGDIAAAETWEREVRTTTGLRHDTDLLRFLWQRPGPPSLNIGDVMSSVFVRLRFQQGEFDRAIALLSELIQHRETQGAFGLSLPMRLLLALSYQSLGKNDAAYSAFLPTLSLARTEGYVRPFVEAGRGLLPLLQRAMAAGEETEFIHTLLPSLEGLPTAIADTAPLETKHPETKRMTDPPAVVEVLTEREVEVLTQVAAGLSNQDIADRLYLSVGTVKRHIHNILGKLDADNRVSAIIRARELGINC